MYGYTLHHFAAATTTSLTPGMSSGLSDSTVDPAPVSITGVCICIKDLIHLVSDLLSQLIYLTQHSIR